MSYQSHDEINSSKHLKIINNPLNINIVKDLIISPELN